MGDGNVEPDHPGHERRLCLSERRDTRPAGAAQHPKPLLDACPWHGEGNFAIESALDELSYTLGIDPIELRLRNYAEVHPQSGLPWSSKALRSATSSAPSDSAGRARTPEVGSMRDGNWLVGYGMAGVTFT